MRELGSTARPWTRTAHCGRHLASSPTVTTEKAVNVLILKVQELKLSSHYDAEAGFVPAMDS